MSNSIPKAATVVGLRDGSDGLEVYLLRRHSNSSFMPDRYVYLGGRFETQDRQCLERDWPEQKPPESQLLASIRERLNRKQITLPEVLNRKSHIQLHTNHLTYFAHWLTPEAKKNRYDTYFFTAEVSQNARAVEDRIETFNGMWISPQKVVDRNKTGQLMLAPPTLITLQQLSQFQTSREALKAFEKETPPTLFGAKAPSFGWSWEGPQSSRAEARGYKLCSNLFSSHKSFRGHSPLNT